MTQDPMTDATTDAERLRGVSDVQRPRGHCADGRPRPGGEGRLAGRPVSRVGYGAMQLADGHGRPVDDDDAVALLRHAVERGVDHIDTAEFYGDGQANRRLRAALHPYPDDLALVSKVGAVHDGAHGLVVAQKPEELRAQVEANLRTLGTDHLAVVNLRRCDVAPGIVAEGDQRVDLDDQLAELAALRDAGLIGAIGLSTVSETQLRRALPVGVACVQNLHNLLDRSGESLLELAAAHDVAWVPYFPLGSAFDGIASVTDDPAVVTVAARLGASPAQVGLAWLLAHDPHVLLIPGTSSVGHLDDNLAAGDLVLDAAALADLDASGSTTGQLTSPGGPSTERSS